MQYGELVHCIIAELSASGLNFLTLVPWQILEV